MFDAVVIGGGIVGCTLAARLGRDGARVLLLERRAGIAERATAINQARVHVGYHYPRSLLTALRSRVNSSRFAADFVGCVVDVERGYYAVARRFSNVTASQFAASCKRIGAPLDEAPERVRRLFDADRIEAVFAVEEPFFDAHELAGALGARLDASGVDLCTETDATAVRAAPDGAVEVDVVRHGDQGRVRARRVYNCTYSQLNGLLHASRLPMLPLKHELTEIALVEAPAALEGMAVTVMCGPFFSITPFPPRGLHALSHVRYTPHAEWADEPGAPWRDSDDVLASHRRESRVPHMLKDATRYLPPVADCRHVDSMWEIKTVLPRNEIDDGRPILFRPDHGIAGLTCILGGKIDNIYDMLDEVEGRADARDANEHR